MNTHRIAVPAQAPAASQPMLTVIQQQFGRVPNVYQVFSLSPVALTGLTGLSGALTRALDAKTRQRIAIAVAEVNGCDYCLSAHTYLGLNLAGLDAQDAALARQGRSTDPRAGAAVGFAAKVARTRGHVGDADLAAVRAAGYSDSQIVEIVALVAENVLTNFLNTVAQTEIDFPVLRVAEAA